MFLMNIIHLCFQAAVINAFVPIATRTKIACDDAALTRRRIGKRIRPIRYNCLDDNEKTIPSTTPGHPLEFVADDDDFPNLADQASLPLYSSPPTTSNDDEEDLNLKVVMAASSQAAALADATLSPDVVEQLVDELATVTNINATTTTTFVESCMDNIEIRSGNGYDDDGNDDKHIIVSSQSNLIDSINPPVTVDVSLDEKISADSLITTRDDPTVGKILKFAIPAIGVWLCSPLLSLIDTSAVGMLSGTTQQAALNPAVAITDYAALLIAFLYTGTTNMVASAQGADHGTDDKPRTAKMMIGSMQMSTYVGLGLGSFLFIFAKPLLTTIIGNDAISPVVFSAAMKYVRIRALGMPAAAVIGSTQAACLGMQDIRSPLYVLAAAAVINFIGDMLFVGQSNPLLGGAAGAAWATVLSQYVAVTFFFQWLCKPKKKTNNIENSQQVINLSDAILQVTSKSEIKDGKKSRKSLRNIMEKLSNLQTTTTKFVNQYDVKKQQASLKNVGTIFNELLRRRTRGGFRGKINVENTRMKSSDSFSSRGFLNNRLSFTDMVRFPDRNTRTKFAPYVLPVTSTQVGRISGYVAMSHVVASSLGTVSMAAQQVIVSIFYCLCPIADSLSLTAQSLVPVISEKEPGIKKADSLRKVLVNFLKAGAIFGGAMMAAVSTIPLLSGFFTCDQAVIGLVNSVVPLLLVFFSVHGFVCGTEGLLLAQKDLSFLGKMYAAFFAIVPFAMLQLKKAALKGTPINLRSVWSVFIGYQVCRCILWLARSFTLQRRTDEEAMGVLTP